MLDSQTTSREIILDCSCFSGTDLDRDIVAYAEWHYMYRLEDEPEWDDSEGWQFVADEALMWMNSVEEESGRHYEIEDNSLFLVIEGEDESHILPA